MRYYRRVALKRRAVFGAAGIAFLAFTHSAALAKDAEGYVEAAKSYSDKGNLKAAEIELRNAIRQAPVFLKL